MIIAQISDTHISVDLPEGAQRLVDLRRTVAAINALDPQPDVVIHTGDLANRGIAQEYAEARSVLAELRARFYPVPGNRDHRSGLRESFISWPCLAHGEPYLQYAVEGYPVRLIGLDSQGGRSQKGDYCETRAAALARALAAHPRRPTAVFMHHPPFEIECGRDPLQFETREAADRVTSTLAAAGTVVRLFCGHAHRETEVDLCGIPASTMPSIAVDLRMGEDPERKIRPPLFQLHRYEAARGFTSESVLAA